ncbi:hypothetical protein LWT92_24595 [Enterobacter hormaechei]|nr:hypothetical protein [Enterobacter hormaechei]
MQQIKSRVAASPYPTYNGSNGATRQQQCECRPGKRQRHPATAMQT